MWENFHGGGLFRRFAIAISAAIVYNESVAEQTLGREDIAMLKIGVQTAVLLERLGIDGTFRLLSDCGFDFVDFSCNA